MSARTEQGPPSRETALTTDEYRELAKTDATVVVLDVRREASVDGTGQEPRGALRVRADQAVAEADRTSIPKSAWIVALCACPNEETSGQAAAHLRAAGWTRARALVGGWNAWRAANLPIGMAQKQ